MENFTLTARERFIERLHRREDFITIPLRGTKVIGFENQLNSTEGIQILVHVNDQGRKTYKLGDTSKKSRSFKIPYKRINIASHVDVVNGQIIRDVAENYSPTLQDTIDFVNLYLNYNINVKDVNELYFNPRGTVLTIRIRKNCLRYTGQLNVHLV